MILHCRLPAVQLLAKKLCEFKTIECLQHDAFIQVYSAKIQPQPAKMPVVMLWASSGEGGFGSPLFKT
jgi:hypothetical protein